MVVEYVLTFTLLTGYTIARHFYDDIKELKVDSRRNYMMYGAILTIGLISHQAVTLLITGIATIAFTLLLGYLESKQGKVVFGDGDKEILGWSIPGIALVFGYGYAAWFIFLLMLSFFGLAALRQTKLMGAVKLPGLAFISFAYLVILIFGWFF